MMKDILQKIQKIFKELKKIFGNILRIDISKKFKDVLRKCRRNFGGHFSENSKNREILEKIYGNMYILERKNLR